ncbi:MAG: HDOD domain-containing protein [Verrucomicrobiota bacterium]|jgi:putative nucleotidyltransferase with HDIG domain
MTATQSTGQKRLCVWAETPEAHRHLQARLPKFRRFLMPVYFHGHELADVINIGRLDGVVFYSPNASLVKLTLSLLEEQCPACSRFVVCAPKDEALFRSWNGIPPTILKEDEKPETWEDRIERAMLLNQWLRKPEFRLILPRLRTIPSLPESHHRVVEALQNPDFHTDDVARLISHDVALTAQLLKIVNSAALGMAHPIHSIPAAVTVLGVARLQSLVMSAWAFFFADEKTCPGFSPAAEWSHALAVAEASQKLAQERRAKPGIIEAAFVTGLLHDVGKVMLAANSPDTYAGILALAKKQKKPLWEAEKEVLTYTHAEVGACVLGLWGLDLFIVEAISHHHDPALHDSQEITPSKLVYDANLQVRAAAHVQDQPL